METPMSHTAGGQGIASDGGRPMSAEYGKGYATAPAPVVDNGARAEPKMRATSRDPIKRLEYNKDYREQKKRRLDEIKAENGCARCGESDPECLDFHHINPATKTYTVARLYAGTWNWRRVLKEIALCELLCANCHRKEHGRDRRR